MVWLSAVLRNIRSARPSSCREPRSHSSSANNVHAFYSCLSAHFTSQPQSETLHYQRLLAAKLSEVLVLIGSGPACLWENCPIRAHGSPGELPGACPLRKLHRFFVCFFFLLIHTVPTLKSGKVPLQKTGREVRAQVDGPYFANLKLFHFFHPSQAEGNIPLTCTRSFYFALRFHRENNFAKNIFILLHILHIWRFPTSTDVKCNL